MLNALPDVAAEFEFQWTADPPSGLHVAMQQPGFDLREALRRVSETAPIRGSKLVVPGIRRMGEEDYAGLRRAIPPGVKLLHLSRNYLHSFLSKFRNAGHLRNPGGVAAPPRTGAWLVDQHPRTLETSGRQAIDLDRLRTDLSNRLATDRFFRSFADRGGDYVFVEYEQIAPRFIDLARHVGSAASAATIADIVRRPPTAKLPPFDYGYTVTNLREVEEVGAAFERERRALVGEATSTRNQPEPFGSHLDTTV